MKAKTIKQSILLLGMFSAQALAVQAATQTVEIRNFAYSPQTVRIKVGDSVTWVQRDTSEHTSTSGVNGDKDGTWDSPALSLNQTFTHTFNQTGNFPYFCEPHPFMTGIVIVEANQANPPTVSITAPDNNTSYPTTTNLTITATAEVTGSTITSVEFFKDALSLGVDQTAPYEVTATFGTGTYQLTAKAVAANGTSTTSTPVTITVQTGGERIDDPFPDRIAKTDLAIEVQEVATGMISPLGLAAPKDGSNRLFVYDQAGLVHIIQDGALLSTPLLDVRSRMVPFRNYDERGLLGMAVHPNFKEKPFIYTYTSEPNGEMADFMIMLPDGKTNNHQSVIAEWRIDAANSNQVDITSRREIMRIDQPQSNHNGGTMRFGPDGFLYISLGDGGAADDQGDGHSTIGNGQDITEILGSVVRIDVDGRTSLNGQYSVPTDNPFVNAAGVDEIYAYGLRNPFAFSFDSLTGELYLADVGQNKVEELDLISRGGNYGWPIKEGSFYFNPNGTNAGFITTLPVITVPPNLVDPIAEYDHDEGLAIVGGYVYRGGKIPALTGRYVTGDWGTFSTPAGRLFVKEGRTFKELQLGRDNRSLGLWIKGFGEDLAGELYVFGSTNVGPSGTSGKMLKIVPLENDLEVTEITRDGTNVTLNWQGGLGPFVVETKTDMGDSVWKTQNTSVERTATFPIDQHAAFFRVADAAGIPAIGFTVSLNGANERPTGTPSTGTGSGILRLEGNTLTFDISYSGLTAAASAAHFHGPAGANESTNVIINLAPFAGGGFGTNGTFSGSVTLTPQQKAIILAGKSYVNIHTENHQPGEIRGQVLPVVYSADLTGAAERPSQVNTSARGSGSFLLSGNELNFNIGYWGLSGVAIGAHIHGPANSTNTANVIIDLAPFNGGAFGIEGAIVGRVTLTPEQMAWLADGLLYVNVHTPANTGGEIRGQILPAVTAIPFSASLSGAAERPDPVTTDATGSAIVTLQGNTLALNANYRGFNSNARMAHIHGPAATTNAASVLIDLAPLHRGPLGTNGIYSGTTVLSELNAQRLRANLTYLNVHTVDNGSGEIRGQIAPVVLHSELLGASERTNAVQTMGNGTAQLLLIGNRVYLNATYSDLSASALAAHIHGPATTSGSAPVLVDLAELHQGEFETSGSFAGFRELTPAQLAAVIDGDTYINVHTTTNQGGEIRGQIVP